MSRTNTQYQIDTLSQASKDLNVVGDSVRPDSTKSYGIKNFESIPIRKTQKLDLAREVKKDKTSQEFIPLQSNVYSWQIIILLITIILVAVSKAYNLSRFKQLTKALLNFSVAQEVTREEKVFFHRANIWLSLTHILSFSLIILQLAIELNLLGEKALWSYYLKFSIFLWTTFRFN